MNKIVIIATGLSLAAGIARAAEQVDFEKDIAPILAEHCIQCHGEDKQKGKLRLDGKADAFKGGKSGTASVVAGDVGKSEIIRRVTLPKDNDEAMPPEGGPLGEKKVAALKAWVEGGAKWPDGFVVKVAAKGGAAAALPPAVPAAPRRPMAPLPELPKDFKPSPSEATALAALAKAGIEARPVAQNSPWREANFRLKGPEVTDKTLEPLKDLASLIEVRLGSTKVSDAGLAALEKLAQLQVLSLELTGVTDAGLARLKNLPNLVYLNLYGTQVTDAGLEHLKGMKHLRSLYLWQTKVTADGAKRLQEALPGCEVNTGAELTIVPPAEKKDEKKKDEKK
ncbi:MAG: c-type cytochrome domain-containing protein [Verrucomicrobiota bacterium]|jgi:mono/diheme cytochrome c family protein